MYELDQIVKTKKPHVCGSNEWKVVRTGADLKLECVGCKRIIMIASYELDKRVKKQTIKGGNNTSIIAYFFVRKHIKTTSEKKFKKSLKSS